MCQSTLFLHKSGKKFREEHSLLRRPYFRSWGGDTSILQVTPYIQILLPENRKKNNETPYFGGLISSKVIDFNTHRKSITSE